MRKGKDSLTFLLTVCVLVIYVAMAKDSGSTSKAKSSTDVVYPDYYAKTSDDLDTTSNKDSNTQTQAAEEEADEATIEEPFVPLADAIPETDSQSEKATKSTKTATHKTVTNTSAQSSTALPISTSILERKSRILSDMAQSSVLNNSAQTLANAAITAKAVKTQAIASGVALGAAQIHNQRREAVVDLIENRQKARTDTVNKLITQNGDTTKDVLNTALTIHNDINQNANKIYDDIKQNKDQIHNDVHDTIDRIHKTHDDIKDKIDNLPHLSDFLE